MPEIALHEVTVTQNEKVILDQISGVFTAASIAVIGENGSGKTTFAKLLAGLVAPSTGTLSVHGIDPVTQEKQLRQRVGFVFSNPQYQFVMPTVLEDLAFGLYTRRKQLGLTKAEVTQKALSLLENSPLKGLEARSVHSLSGGQQQLLALLSVFITDPALVIADEPTALLDLRNAKNIGNRLLQSHVEQTIIVTHDLELAAGCEEALWFADGQIVRRGAAAQVVSAYRESC